MSACLERPDEEFENRMVKIERNLARIYWLPPELHTYIGSLIDCLLTINEGLYIGLSRPKRISFFHDEQSYRSSVVKHLSQNLSRRSHCCFSITFGKTEKVTEEIFGLFEGA